MRSSQPNFFIINILFVRKALVEISLCFYRQNVMWTVVWTVVWTVCGLCVDCVLTVVDRALTRAPAGPAVSNPELILTVW